MRSRTPPISSEFRGGFEHPNPFPPRYATAHCQYCFNVWDTFQPSNPWCVHPNDIYCRLCHKLLSPPFTSSTLGPNILFSTKFSKTLKLFQLITEWRTKCHTIDCAHYTFLLLQKHLTSDTEWSIENTRPAPTRSDTCASTNAATLKLISRPPARRPACRVQVRHAYLPDRLRVLTPIYLLCIRRRSRTRLLFCRCVCKRPDCLETAIKTCMKLTSAECTVEKSWWWAERMPETYRVFKQNKFG